MSRVYLMADFGKGPRCKVSFHPRNLHGPGRPWGFQPLRWAAAHPAARAWWLVEAESAEAARYLIALAPDGSGRDVLDGRNPPIGRILDSGGAPCA